MTQEMTAQSPKLLLNKTFDLFLVVGIPFLALLPLVSLSVYPELLPLIVLVNTYALGMHHVVATYTRMVLRKEDFQKYKFLVVWLPFIVLAATLALGYVGGVIAIATVYFFWQAYHYTRQSYGVSRQYNHDPLYGKPIVQEYPIYAIAITGVAYRCFQQHSEFLFNPIYLPEIPFFVVQFFGVVTAALIANQVAFIAKHWHYYSQNRFYVYYLISHYLVFTIAYTAIPDITFGWLVINIWHNAQYIAFVWYANHKQFTKTPDNTLISRLSQSGMKNMSMYFGLSLIAAFIFYAALDFSLLSFQSSAAGALPIFMIGYMTINFHHYIVDSIIWKRRKSSQS